MCKENVYCALEKLKEGCWTGARKMKKSERYLWAKQVNLITLGCIKD